LQIETDSEAAMIVRTWRGWTAADTADDYSAFLRGVALNEYADIPGNVEAYALRRPLADGVEFLTVSFWESPAAVRELAAPNRHVAVPEDARYLVGRETIGSFWDVVR
jgi:heme-degrading monooxygenase HmoA